MVGVTKEGTSRGVFAGAAYQSGGKTGTAQAVGVGQNQKYNAAALAERKRDHSLYIAFAAAFQVPIVVMLLVRFGLVEVEKLKAFRGYFVVLAFVIAAVITPPDVISQLALALPMCLLYEIGILGAGWFSRVSRAPDAEEGTGTEVEKSTDGH